MVPFLRAQKANVPTLGPRFLVKFLMVGQAIVVKSLTFAWGRPIGLNIDRCIKKLGKLFFLGTQH